MKPKILIIANTAYMKKATPFMINPKLTDAIEKVGATPIVVLNAKSVDDYFDIADGVIFTDAENLYSECCNDSSATTDSLPPLERESEAEEWHICKICEEKKLPVLGIGNGMQVINVYTGGNLTYQMQGEANHLSRKNGFLTHTVSVTLDTFIAYDPFKAEVNSAHSRCLKLLGENIRVCAVAEDGVAEAIEHKKLPWFGVQWHPEYMEGVCGEKILANFVKVCKEK